MDGFVFVLLGGGYGACVMRFSGPSPTGEGPFCQEGGGAMARLEHYLCVGKQRLRCGYTTGTCAAAADRGAAEGLSLIHI